MNEPYVDSLWFSLRSLVGGLQSAGRLPETGHLYDARQEIVKDHLRRWDPRGDAAGFGASGIERALQEAGSISGRNHGASFLAFELIKLYCSCVGDEDHERQAAQRATDELTKAEKELAKQRKKRGW